MNWLTTQHLPAGVGDGDVHRARGVGEHAQVPHLLGQLARDGVVVAVGHAHEHAEAGADLADHRAVDPDTRFGDTLDQRAHDGP